MSKRVVVVDIGIGNLRSVQKALEAAGEGRVQVVRSGDPELVRRADRLVVPGQSGFGDVALALKSAGLDQALSEAVKAGTPYFGMCLGLQVLFEGSEEAEGLPGLGWFKGRVKKLVRSPEIKIPHMGWNQLEIPAETHPYLADVGGAGSWFYFVHSFHAVPDDPAVLQATVSYGPNRVTAAVGRDNVFATQFHPEKSQANGLKLLGSFLRR
ncbi:MAG TPA: imidazole glycerol phosphate synthase subunit HisH [Polyangiaceae bacterium]|nr:imidazole glycerol phosphate synthase subunit HisH [Polyangiaceae bacterium]